MSQFTECTLAGAPLLADRPIHWSFAAGVQAVKGVFFLERSEAEKVLQTASPQLGKTTIGGDGVELVISSPGYPMLTVQRLFPLALVPSPHPDIMGVEVGDIRTWWPRIHIARSYNIPRKTADTRRLQQEGVPIEITEVVPTVSYAPWSLKGGVDPWDAESILDDVLKAIQTATPGGFSFRKLFGNIAGALPTQGIQIDEAAPDALLRILSLVPGATIYIDSHGDVVGFNRRSGFEEDLLRAAPDPIVGGHLSEKISFAHVRPKEVRVFFTREVELRLDEPPQTITADQVRFIEPVVPVPDVSLTVGAHVYCTGSWIHFRDAENAWAASEPPRPPTSSGAPGPIHPVTRGLLAAFPFHPTYEAMVYGGSPELASPVLSHRLRAVITHFRRTFRVDRRLLDRLSHIRANRVAILDPVTQTRAPAMVYTKWATRFTIRGLDYRDMKKTALASNESSFAGDTRIITGARAAPFKVSVTDEEQGIITIDPQLDYFTGKHAIVIMGEAVGPNGVDMPVGDPRESAPNGIGSMEQNIHLRYAGGSGLGVAGPGLYDRHEITVILTVIPGSPNDETRFHMEKVTPEEAAVALNVDAGVLADSTGPPWMIRVRPQLQTARFAWDESATTQIETMIGLTPTVNVDYRYLGGGAQNTGTVVPINQGKLKAIAKAAAASIYAALIDRVEGGRTLPLSPDIFPTGNLLQVDHVLSPSGEATTSVTLPPQLAPVDILAILPESIRRDIMGLIGARGEGF